jgi:hypothetical protein
MRVWKYTLPVGGGEVSMSVGATPLTVGAQGGQLVLWALVEPSETLEQRRFIVYGTGHDIPFQRDQLRYVASTTMGPLVWHVFEFVIPLLSGEEWAWVSVMLDDINERMAAGETIDEYEIHDRLAARFGQEKAEEVHDYVERLLAEDGAA